MNQETTAAMPDYGYTATNLAKAAEQRGLVERPVQTELDKLDKACDVLNESLATLEGRLFSVRNINPSETQSADNAYANSPKISDRIASLRYRVEQMHTNVSTLLSELEV